MNYSILVSYHKNDVIYKDSVYVPIQVGRSISPLRLDMIGDDTGDNISSKNGSYCELTALYWAWKNLKGVDYIGLCHYRRFFDFYKVIPCFYSYKDEDIKNFGSYNFSLPESLKEKLNNGYVVVAKPMYLKRSLFVHYCNCHVPGDLKKLRDIICESCTSDFVEAFDKVMSGNKLSPYNMFIMSWKDFDEYCSWLFSILFKLEARIDTAEYTQYQKRIFGFMSERLLSVFLYAKNKKCQYYPVIRFVDEHDVKNYSFVRQLFSTMNKRIRFFLSSKPKKYNIG